MTKITVSAPAKIHLLGEHAVVYGKPALLTAINLRLFLTIFPSTKKYQHSKTFPNDESADAFQQAIEDSIKLRFNLKKIPFYSIEVSSDIPMGSGLGSSAAFSTAFVAALLKFLKIIPEQSLVMEIAYEGEKVFHGNPSGADNATSAYGGFVWFRKEHEMLKLIQPIKKGLHPKIGQFVLIDSGRPVESTKEMVTKVRLLRENNPKKIDTILNHQEQITKMLLEALLEGKPDQVISLIRAGEANLEKIGVVGKKVKAIVKQIESLGGACKILGGGGFKDGSGMLLAYHANSKLLQNLINQNNWKYQKITLGEGGLRVE